MKTKWLLLLTALTTPVISRSQTIYSLRSINESSFPEIRWYSTIFKDTVNFDIYRSGMEETDFLPVKTLHGKTLKGDSLVYWIVDTTLNKEGLFKYFITMPLSTDSVIRSELMYAHNFGALPSPQVIKFNAKPAENKKAIDLSWKLNYNFTVSTLSIYRSENYEDGYHLIARLSGDAESFTDPIEVANEAYYYFILIHDYFGYSLPSVRIHGIATYSEKPIPPQHFDLKYDGEQTHLHWEQVGNNIIGFRVYRQSNDFGSFFPITGTIPSQGKNTSFTDTTVHYYKNRHIRYYVVSVSDGFQESNPTDTIGVYTEGEILKASPKACDHVIDSIGRVMLIWTSQEKDVEVKGYNVYHAVNENEKTKLNSSLIPYNRNYFTVDKALKGNNTFEIETVSISNTPSLMRTKLTVNSQDVPLHLILSVKKTGKSILIAGTSLNNPDIKKIVLYRRIDSSAPTELIKLSPDKIMYTDLNVSEGKLYTYFAVAVLKDNSSVVVNEGVMIRY